MVVTSFDRPNLYFSVRLKDSDKDIVGDLERLMVRDGLLKKFPGPTIIYCPTKKVTEKVAEALSREFSLLSFNLNLFGFFQTFLVKKDYCFVGDC